MARKARTPRPIISGGGGFRARRGERLFRYFLAFSFIAIFIVPTISATVYFTLVASNQYISEARFTVKAGGSTSIAGFSGLSSFIDTGQSKDGLMIAEYIKSRALIDELEGQLPLRDIFRGPEADYFSSLPSDATMDKFVTYWRRQIDVEVNRNSGLVIVKVRTFRPEDSLKVLSAIIESSEKMVNRLTQKNEQDAFDSSKKELDRSKSDLERATASLRDARNAAGLLNVEVTAGEYSGIVAALRLELSKIEQKIYGLTNGQASASPQLTSLQASAQALRQQITSYDESIAGSAKFNSESVVNLASKASNMAQKEVEAQIAREAFAIASVTFEQARQTIETQRSYLLTYVTPNLPEEAEYPKRPLSLIIVMGVMFLAWAVVAGLATFARDHMAA